jgi:hypothetical protein
MRTNERRVLLVGDRAQLGLEPPFMLTLQNYESTKMSAVVDYDRLLSE